MSKEAITPLQRNAERLPLDLQGLKRVKPSMEREKQLRPDMTNEIDRFIGLTDSIINDLERELAITRIMVGEVEPRKPTRDSGKAMQFKSPLLLITPGEIPNEPPKAIIEARVAEVFTSLAKTIPDPREARNGTVQKELMAIASNVVKVADGTMTLPKPSDFLETEPQQKIELGTKALQVIVASRIISNGEVQKRTFGLQLKVATRVNELIHLLGKNGEGLFETALSNLSSAERVLLFIGMSTSLKSRLGFPDIDECSEVQMAGYLKVALQDLGFKHYGEEEVEGQRKNRRAIIQLVEACGDRANEEKFSMSKVLGKILKDKNSALMLKSLIDVCEDSENLDLLEELFLHHSETYELAKECMSRRLPLGVENYD